MIDVASSVDLSDELIRRYSVAFAAMAVLALKERSGSRCIRRHRPRI
ncbi:MAG: hypothetical protein LUQ22_00135 [Methanotrichaceae archaeon]|nr:hypothetical protein [Methanotrichaceae archaeon]